jgi:hypothetical protein
VGTEQAFYELALALPEAEQERAFAKLSARFRNDHGIHILPSRVRELNGKQLFMGEIQN